MKGNAIPVLNPILQTGGELIPGCRGDLESHRLAAAVFHGYVEEGISVFLQEFRSAIVFFTIFESDQIIFSDLVC